MRATRMAGFIEGADSCLRALLSECLHACVGEDNAKLNAWREDRCRAYARANKHPEMRDGTIWEMFEDERPSLVPYVGPFDLCPAGDLQCKSPERGIPRCAGLCVQDLPRAVRQLGGSAKGPGDLLPDERHTRSMPVPPVMVCHANHCRAVVGRPVEIRADADRLECWQDGRIVRPAAFSASWSVGPAAAGPTRDIAAQCPAEQ